MTALFTPVICNKCAIIDFTERTAKRLHEFMKKVFADMTEGVR